MAKAGGLCVTIWFVDVFVDKDYWANDIILLCVYNMYMYYVRVLWIYTYIGARYVTLSVNRK